MAEGKYMKWLEPDSLILLRGWARDGLTDKQIAKNIGISRQTLYTWKASYSDIDDALKAGKEVADYAMENALYISGIEGNVTAMIFWLKNRKSKQWRDKPIDEASTAREVEDLTPLVEKLKL